MRDQKSTYYVTVRRHYLTKGQTFTAHGVKEKARMKRQFEKQGYYVTVRKK